MFFCDNIVIKVDICILLRDFATGEVRTLLEDICFNKEQEYGAEHSSDSQDHIVASQICRGVDISINLVDIKVG